MVECGRCVPVRLIARRRSSSSLVDLRTALLVKLKKHFRVTITDWNSLGGVGLRESTQIDYRLLLLNHLMLVVNTDGLIRVSLCDRRMAIVETFILLLGLMVELIH